MTNTAGTSTTVVFTGQTVARNGGPSATVTQSFTVAGTPIAAPNVTGVNPDTGSTAGGTTVTITGTALTTPVAVTFGGVPATSVTAVSPTEVTAVSPSTDAGTVDVQVTTTHGQSPLTPADHFTYVDAPAVSSVTPTSGPAAGGTTTTITGSGFTGATAVSFGSTAATSFTVDSDTQITAVSPAGTAGAVDVTVTTPYGQSLPDGGGEFTYVALGEVTGVTPSAGPTAGGTTVTLTGSGFTGATAVHFGSTAATSFTVDSDTQITAASPPGTAGAVDVTVTTVSGSSPAERARPVHLLRAADGRARWRRVPDRAAVGRRCSSRAPISTEPARSTSGPARPPTTRPRPTSRCWRRRRRAQAR